MTKAPSDPMRDTLVTLFEPLAQMMISRGVTLGTATEVLKQALVGAVEMMEESRPTDSKISLRTGLHRKDVKRLRDQTPSQPGKPKLNAAARAISRWVHDPRFCQPDKTPRDLSRHGEPAEPGFDDLVRAAKIDLPPATVLAELAEQQLVELLPDGELRLLATTYLVREGDDVTLRAFEATVIDHLRAATHNLSAKEGEARCFDRAVRYSHLSRDSVDFLEQEARDQAQHLLEKINALAYDLQQKDADQAHANDGKFVLGAYVRPTPAGHSQPVSQSQRKIQDNDLSS